VKLSLDSPRFASVGRTSQTRSPYEVREKSAQAASEIKRDAPALGLCDNLETSIVSFVLAASVTLSS
jgi:hypothetical protein